MKRTATKVFLASIFISGLLLATVANPADSLLAAFFRAACGGFLVGFAAMEYGRRFS